MESLWQLQIEITLFLQGLGEWLTLPMKAVSFLGQEEFFLMIMPLVYWCIDSSIGLRIGMMLLISNGINNLFKVSLHGPRPYWFDADVVGYASESTFGLPSNHAQIAASVWGFMAVLLRKRWFTILALVVIFLIGISRIYLGVHFTTDVLVGWLIGGLLVWTFAVLDRPVTNRIHGMPMSNLIGLLFITSLVLILFAMLPALLSSGWTMPAAWLDNALLAFPQVEIDPLDPSNAFTVAGTWFGMTAGAAWLFRTKGGLASGGPVGKRILRFVIGTLVLLILWYGLGQIFPRNPDLLSYSLRYFRYTLIGLWVSAGAPLVFQRFGLLESKRFDYNYGVN